MDRIRHMATRTITVPDSVPATARSVSAAKAALRKEIARAGTTDPDRTMAAQIGPREPGVVYENIDGAFRVLDVTTDASEARRILKRRAAQFAITIIDTLRPDAQPFAVGTVWTGSDRVLKAVA